MSFSKLKPLCATRASTLQLRPLFTDKVLLKGSVLTFAEHVQQPIFVLLNLLLMDHNRQKMLILFLFRLSQQQSPPGDKASVSHQLLQVIVRVAQYRMLLTGGSRAKYSNKEIKNTFIQ